MIYRIGEQFSILGKGELNLIRELAEEQPTTTEGRGTVISPEQDQTPSKIDKTTLDNI